MVDIATSLGLSVFIGSLIAFGILVWINETRRVDLSLPYGFSIPYVVAVSGALVFFFAWRGILGVFGALATALVLGFVMQEVVPRVKSEE